MTKEEIIQLNIDYLNGCESKQKMNEFFSYALEQQPFDEYGNYKYPSDVELIEPNTATSIPCDNAISRIVTLSQKDEDIAKAFQIGLALGFGKNYDEMDKIIDEIKKVAIPQQKTGYWIYDRRRDLDGECKYECSECGMGSDVDYAYCMRCGAIMAGRRDR